MCYIEYISKVNHERHKTVNNNTTFTEEQIQAFCLAIENENTYNNPAEDKDDWLATPESVVETAEPITNFTNSKPNKEGLFIREGWQPAKGEPRVTLYAMVFGNKTAIFTI